MNISLRENNGFSLIELMVVVAIIGILSAVAVPQFQKFQRKAKQAEARANLSGMYMAQKTFLAEHNTYYNNLVAIGFLPEGKYKYRIGDLGSSSTVTRPSTLGPVAGSTGYTNPDVYKETYNMCRGTYADKLVSDISNYGQNCFVEGPLCASSLFPAGVATTQSTFVLGACGQLGGATEDTWTMSHRKELINVKNGAL